VELDQPNPLTVAQPGSVREPTMKYSNIVISDEEKIFSAVREAWQTILPRGRFELDLSLGDAGVDSLKAMELVLRLERALNCKVPYNLLEANTTPRTLALNLSRHGARQSSVNKPLLFFMSGISGHPVDMVRSWQEVVEEMKLVLVDAPGLNRPRAVLVDLSATAAEVAAEIERRQPDGDIRLMGYSYGAALAYAVALQLQTQGRRIAFLGLIDLLPVRGVFLRLAYAARSPRALARKLAARLPRLKRRKQSHDNRTLLIQTAIRVDAHGLASRLARARADRKGLDAAMADWLEIHHCRAQALRYWRPEPIDVPALLIASDDGVLAGSPHFWRSRITGLRVVEVEGSHDKLAIGPGRANAVQSLREALGLSS
jgi:thioesterase domain-containing protein/acyl carrier protein